MRMLVESISRAIAPHSSVLSGFFFYWLPLGGKTFYLGTMVRCVSGWQLATAPRISMQYCVPVVTQRTIFITKFDVLRRVLQLFLLLSTHSFV
jgi:hypothetical protein